METVFKDMFKDDINSPFNKYQEFKCLTPDKYNYNRKKNERNKENFVNNKNNYEYKDHTPSPPRRNRFNNFNENKSNLYKKENNIFLDNSQYNDIASAKINIPNIFNELDPFKNYNIPTEPKENNYNYNNNQNIPNLKTKNHRIIHKTPEKISKNSEIINLNNDLNKAIKDLKEQKKINDNLKKEIDIEINKRKNLENEHIDEITKLKNKYRNKIKK